MALYTAQIEKLYVTFFNRPADFSGLAYWEGQMVKTNGDSAVIANAFAASAEYKALYAGKSTAATIETIYQNLFGRAAEPDAIQYWGVRLDNGTFNIGTIANSIAVGAQNLDATTIANKVTAATAFTTALDTNAEILGYETTTNGQAVKDWLKAVTSDAATLTAATTALPALVTAVVTNSNANPGTTFTLTTGTDNLTGTAGNDIFNGAEVTFTDAAPSVASGSYGILDNINGGTGTDTLNIAVQGGGAANYLTAALPGATLTGVEVLNIRAIQTEAADIVSIAASTVSGLTNVNTDRSTSAVTVTALASGAQAGMISSSGAFNAGWAATAPAAVLNVSGGVTGGLVTLTGAAVTGTTVNSTGSTANVLGGLVLPATTNTSLTINATAGLTTGAITGTGLTTITVTGSATTGSATTVAGEATSAVRLGTAPATVTTIDASGMTAGGVAATLVDGVTSFKGGQGNDAVTTAALTSTVASIIDAGAGTADVLTLADAAHVDTAIEAKQYANFEVLDTGIVAANAALFTNSAITALKVGASTATISNISAAQAADVTVYGSSNAVYNVTGAATVGQLDTLTLKVNDGLTATNTYTLANIQAAGVETINLVANDNIIVTTLAAGALAMTNMNITGSKTVSVTSGALALNVNTIIDATAATGAITIDLTDGSANGAAIKGSTAAVVNTLTGTAQADSITGGAGNDILKGLAGNDTINGGAGNDTITGGAGVDTINVGSGTDIIVLSAAADTQEGVLATGASMATSDKITGMGTLDQINLASMANLTLADGAITVGTTFATATANLVTIVSGSYDTTTLLFTAGLASATNNDYLVQYNGGTSATTVNSALLIDIVGTVTANSAGEVITLSVI